VAVTLQSRIVRSPDQAFAHVGDELVMVHLGQGKYFAIDAIGAEVWARIEAPAVVADVCADLQATFDVAADECERDVLAFLMRLVERGLARVV
jgi:hypothetical protein